MKELLFYPAAKSDLDAIWNYGNQNWGPDKADSYIDDIWGVCYDLAEGTRVGGEVSVNNRFKKTLCLSHVIFLKKMTTA